ncbi:MAG: hypothetical protein M1829_004371 [Trizodia sp. TS-e1964]|nr:MAG: hypothetical protein M1829_004371 [Trizodia sp. TS-e1964]
MHLSRTLTVLFAASIAAAAPLLSSSHRVTIALGTTAPFSAPPLAPPLVRRAQSSPQKEKLTASFFLSLSNAQLSELKAGLEAAQERDTLAIYALNPLISTQLEWAIGMLHDVPKNGVLDEDSAEFLAKLLAGLRALVQPLSYLCFTALFYPFYAIKRHEHKPAVKSFSRHESCGDRYLPLDFCNCLPSRLQHARLSPTSSPIVGVPSSNGAPSRQRNTACPRHHSGAIPLLLPDAQNAARTRPTQQLAGPLSTARLRQLTPEQLDALRNKFNSEGDLDHAAAGSSPETIRQVVLLMRAIDFAEGSMEGGQEMGEAEAQDLARRFAGLKAYVGANSADLPGMKGFFDSIDKGEGGEVIG